MRKWCVVWLLGTIVVGTWCVAQAQVDPSAREVFDRISASIPHTATVEADWTLVLPPDDRMDPEAALRGLRADFERHNPRDPFIHRNVESSRALYEHIRQGGTEEKKVVYAWTPDCSRDEEWLISPGGTPQHNVHVTANGVSYRIVCGTNVPGGVGQVEPGDTVRRGSLTELVFLRALRLSDFVDPASLSVARGARGTFLLRGVMDNHAGRRSVPDGAAFEIIAAPETGYVPTRMHVWARGRLYETAEITPSRFGDLWFASELKVVRYSRRDSEPFRWHIRVHRVMQAAAGCEDPPVAPVALSVSDLRRDPPHVYELQAGERFLSLDQLGRADRSNIFAAENLLRTAGVMLLVGAALPLYRRRRNAG